jgi:hypothetical protein
MPDSATPVGEARIALGPQVMRDWSARGGTAGQADPVWGMPTLVWANPTRPGSG